MTGTELLAMLKAHPKACGLIGLSFGLGCAGTPMVYNDHMSLLEHETGGWCGVFETWLLGATTRWCDEHWIDVIQSNGRYIASTGCDEHYQELSSRESRLSANLAAMEAHTT